MAMYGGYEFTENGNEEKAKENLKKEIHEVIDKLCEIDQFWIVKENAPGIPEGEKFVGWKIEIPQITFKRVVVATKNGEVLKDSEGKPRTFESVLCAVSLLKDGEWDEIKSIVIDKDADLDVENAFADFEIKVVEED